MSRRRPVRASLAGVLFASSLVAACSSSDATPAAPPAPGPSPSSRPDAPSTTPPSSSTTPPSTLPGSGGKGGLTCSTHEPLTPTRTTCVTNVGSVQLKLFLPVGGSGAMRLGLYLHGDGAAAHKSNSALKAMIAWADAQHAIAVSALAPNGCSWWLSPTYDCVSQGQRDLAGTNVGALATAIEGLMRAYDVRTDGLRYYGSSGGSIFLTEAWLPLKGAIFPGVFALMCGGEASTRPYAWNTTDASLRAKSALWFTYGDQDALVPDIQASITDFRSKQFAVTERVIPGAGHCEFNAHAEALGIWTANP